MNIFNEANYIGIDTSLNSTGLVVNDKVFCYNNKEDIYTSKGAYTKWFDYLNPFISIREYNKISSDIEYSESEIFKFKRSEEIANDIITDILANINPNIPTYVAIEGYSYNSEVGRLIDLVTIQTLIRRNLLLNKFILKVVSPSTLKLETCKMTYEPLIVSKANAKKIKYSYKNPDGIAGGNFQKPHMYKAIFENDKWTDSYKINISRFYKEAMSNSKIPKPIDDINDAYLLQKYVINFFINLYY